MPISIYIYRCIKWPDVHIYKRLLRASSSEIFINVCYGISRIIRKSVLLLSIPVTCAMNRSVDSIRISIYISHSVSMVFFCSLASLTQIGIENFRCRGFFPLTEDKIAVDFLIIVICEACYRGRLFIQISLSFVYSALPTATLILFVLILLYYWGTRKPKGYPPGT